MILDAETFEQVAAVDRILRGVEGIELPGHVKTELFASVFETNTDVCATAAEVDEALPVLRRAAGGCGRGRGPRDRGRRRRIRSRCPRRSRSSRRSATSTFVGYGGISVRRQGVQGLHVHVGMPSARGLLALPRSDRAVAAGRARALGELALVRRRADRHGVEPCAGARRAAAAPARRRRSRRTPSGRRGSSGSSRSASTAGLHAHLVGRPAAPEARDARGAHRRPADRRASLGGVHRAAAGDVRDGARRRVAARTTRCSVTGAAPTTRRTAGRRRASGRARNLLHPNGSATSRARARRESCSSSSARGARARRRGVLARIDPRGCEADLQLQSDTAAEATADVVARTLG